MSEKTEYHELGAEEKAFVQMRVISVYNLLSSWTSHLFRISLLLGDLRMDAQLLPGTYDSHSGSDGNAMPINSSSTNMLSKF